MYLLSALLLGLLVALNPCQLAINVSAITWIDKRSGVARRLPQCIGYVVGRTLMYTLLGWLLMALVKYGLSIDGVQSWLSRGESLLPWVLIALGLWLVWRMFHHHHHCHSHDEHCHHSGDVIRRSGKGGSWVLGLALALVFCPESALMYFGMMVPLGVSSGWGGWLVPVCFALSAAVPVVLLSILFDKGGDRLAHFEHTFAHFQFWMDLLLALACFVVAALFLFHG